MVIGSGFELKGSDYYESWTFPIIPIFFSRLFLRELQIYGRENLSSKIVVLSKLNLRLYKSKDRERHIVFGEGVGRFMKSLTVESNSSRVPVWVGG